MLLIASEMNKKKTSGILRSGAAAEFVENRLAEGSVSFILRELVDSSGLSTVAANNQLLRLKHRVVRVSRPQPFFLIVPPQHRPMGAPPVEWWLGDYFRWLGHPYYLALLSAAEVYGAAPQAVLVHQVMTDVPRREVTVGRLRVRFFMKRGISKTLVRQPANAYAPLRVSTPEATALDLVRYAGRIGGFGRVLETIDSLLPKLHGRELKRALDAERDTASAQRLGYLVEKAGAHHLAEVIHRWLPPRVKWVSLGLAEGGASRDHRDERWRIILPAGGLP